MKNLIIISNRLKNDINGNPRYSLQAVDSNGLICNYLLIKAGYKQDKKGVIKTTTYNLSGVVDKLKALNLDYNDIILAKF